MILLTGRLLVDVDDDSVVKFFGRDLLLIASKEGGRGAKVLRTWKAFPVILVPVNWRRLRGG
jgi:hypothetical protein